MANSRQEHTIDDSTIRWLSPDDQIAEIRTSISLLRALPASPLRDLQLRDAEEYLDQLRTLHACGEMTPISDSLELGV